MAATTQLMTQISTAADSPLRRVCSHQYCRPQPMTQISTVADSSPMDHAGHTVKNSARKAVGHRGRPAHTHLGALSQIPVQNTATFWGFVYLTSGENYSFIFRSLSRIRAILSSQHLMRFIHLVHIFIRCALLPNTFLWSHISGRAPPYGLPNHALIWYYGEPRSTVLSSFRLPFLYTEECPRDSTLELEYCSAFALIYILLDVNLCSFTCWQPCR